MPVAAHSSSSSSSREKRNGENDNNSKSQPADRAANGSANGGNRNGNGNDGGGQQAAQRHGRFDHSLAEKVSFSTEPLQLTQVNVPRHLVGDTYGAVRLHASKQGSAALGLYRPSGHKGSAMPYMVTNPRPRTRLVAGDRVLLLRHTTSENFGYLSPPPNNTTAPVL
mmetsp:Transcript_38502/g.65540  ORF Transcript_38502/g.65540 Transcript_38502/m.65540 type:complete len:167 (+) Transcript_38502:67-567(+)